MNEKIKENLKLKIAISKIKNENQKNENRKEKFILKNVGMVACIVVSLSGVAFASSKVIEKIWKTPEKINFSSGGIEEASKITEDSKKQNITEEQAKEIAINKLNQVGINSDIVKTNNYKMYDSDKIMYRFITKNGYEISINGASGEFYDIWNNNAKQDVNKYMTEEQAKELANKYYKLYGFKDGEYEISKISSVNNEGKDRGPGFRMTVLYNKKYGGIYNPYEYVAITLESKNMELVMLRTENIPFENNEAKITKNEAINIATEADKKVETRNIKSINTQLMAVKMNAEAYSRLQNKEKYYEQMKENDESKRDYYKVEDRIRRAWVVVIKYDGDFTENDIVKSQYTYFIDCTTGEIIGGSISDYIYVSNL